VFAYLAEKLPLSRASEVEKKKFFAYLESYARFCGEDESRSRLMGFKLK
jgi:hypothetical protein